MGDPSVPSDQLGDSSAVELTGKIMVVAIIILFMVVVSVLFLHLYAKWFWWSTTDESGGLHPRRRRRRFVFAPGQDPAGSRGALRRGLDPSILKSLPVVVFPSQDFKEGLECAVCLSEVSEGEKARLLPKCNHGFHVDCIDMWFQSHSTCPLCRNPVPSSEAEDSVGGAESQAFPTNVFIWGNQTQVRSTGASLELEESSTSQPPCSSSSSSSSAATSSNSNRPHGALVIDIPSEITSSSLSPSGEMKSPMTARLRSLKRLLSREKRFNPCSPRSVDVELAGEGQS